MSCDHVHTAVTPVDIVSRRAALRNEPDARTAVDWYPSLPPSLPPPGCMAPDKIHGAS